MKTHTLSIYNTSKKSKNMEKDSFNEKEINGLKEELVDAINKEIDMEIDALNISNEKEGIEKEIETINFSIEMLLNTLRDPKTTSPEEIMCAIVENKNRQNELKNMLIKLTNNEFKLQPKQNSLKNDICGVCGNFPINEPLYMNNFIIKSLKKYGISESDIVSFDYNSSSILTIKFRDSRNTDLNKLFNNVGKEKQDETIEIDVLDKTLKTVYTITFYKCVYCGISGCGGDYCSSDPRTITLTIDYKKIFFHYN